MAQPVRAHPRCPRPGAVGPVDFAHPGLGHRPPPRNTTKHSRVAAAGWAFAAQVNRQLGEELRIDRDGALLAALAEHPNPAQTEIDIGEQQSAHLHRP